MNGPLSTMYSTDTEFWIGEFENWLLDSLNTNSKTKQFFLIEYWSRYFGESCKWQRTIGNDCLFHDTELFSQSCPKRVEWCYWIKNYSTRHSLGYHSSSHLETKGKTIHERGSLWSWNRRYVKLEKSQKQILLPPILPSFFWPRPVRSYVETGFFLSPPISVFLSK